jgi:acyl carrier protein
VLARIVPFARQASFGEDLSRLKGWDSLCALRVSVALEREFGVTLPHGLLNAQPRIEALAKAIATTGWKPEEGRG